MIAIAMGGLFYFSYNAYFESINAAIFDSRIWRSLGKISIATMFAMSIFLTLEQTVPLMITKAIGVNAESSFVVVAKRGVSGRRQGVEYIYGNWHPCNYGITVSRSIKSNNKVTRTGRNICTIGKEAWNNTQIGDSVTVYGTKSWVGTFIENVKVH